MDVQVRGRNLRISPRLRQLARDKLTKIVRFTHDATRVDVEFSEVRNRRVGDNQVCEVTVHLKRRFVKAHAAAAEQAAALDLVIDKVEHQVSRIKEKRVARSHLRHHVRTPPDLAPASRPDGVLQEAEDEEAESKIVRKRQLATKPMGPEEAALQLDALGHDFFLFTNSENGHAAVIYRRRDGNLGLIETPG